MSVTKQVIVGLCIVSAALFAMMMGLKNEVEQKHQIIVDLHKLYPCQHSKGETSGQYDTIKIHCLDDRQKPIYNCGDGECNYTCLCHPDPIK